MAFRRLSQAFRSSSDGVQGQHTQDNITDNNNPSCDIPPSILLDTSPSEGIPKNILAFRTITKLLSQIQQDRVFQVLQSGPKPLSKLQRQELKLSNAFSTVAVMDHEVIAAITKRTPDSLDVMCAPINDAPPITPSPSRWGFMATQNVRWNRLPSTNRSREPTISDASVLADIDLDDDEKLKLHVSEHW